MSICGESHPTNLELSCTRPLHPFGMHSHDPSGTYWDGEPIPSASSRKDNQKLMEQIVKSAQGNVGYQATLDSVVDSEKDLVIQLRRLGYVVHRPGECSDLSSSVKKNYRSNDPATSKAAAESVIFRSGSQKAKLLSVYAKQIEGREEIQGLTDEEAAEQAGLSLSSEYATRCSELRDSGFIEPLTNDSGTVLTREGKAGVERMLCYITSKGLFALAESQKDRALS